MKYLSLLLLYFFSVNVATAQLMQAKHHYTRADSLRGSLRPERTGFDVLKYDLYVDVDIAHKYISGHNDISFKVTHRLPVMQLDLFANMQVDSILYHGRKLAYDRLYNAVFIHFRKPLKKGTTDKLRFYYSGNPIIAKRPPWDGGFIFTHDKDGNPWVSVAVQGTGASLWYPNKDTQSDEPESAEIHVTTPPNLMNVSNGRFTGKTVLPDGRITWSWLVQSPINNYNLVLNIGNYVHFGDHFGDLDLSYYVMPYNEEKAREQFQEVNFMLKCFTNKFGPYPFEKDSYKLIETPYLGMEHQSGIGYGNHYKNGYAGTDLSKTGVGLKWDFIIIHESAHEWFGNSITAADIADMWIHEAFASYAEAMYVECRWGEEKAVTYLNGVRKTMIENDRPIIGDYGVNSEGSGDMYYKGANMLLTLRSVIANDTKWWKLLKSFSTSFRHRITNTEEVVSFFTDHLRHYDFDVKAFFDQYLRYATLPELQLKAENGQVYYRWQADETDFDIPVAVTVNGESQRLHPTKYWQKVKDVTDLNNLKVDQRNFYINVTKL